MYTILTGSSPELLWGILGLGDLAAIVLQDKSLRGLQQNLDGVDARVLASQVR